MDGILRSDEQHRADLEWANEAFIQAMWGAYPDRMIAAGARPCEERPVRRLKRKSAALEEWQPSVSAVEYHNPEYVWQAPNYVRRDPCMKCGARGDVGCKHKRAAA